MKKAKIQRKAPKAQNDQIVQLIQMYAQSAGVDPTQVMQALHKMNPQAQQKALQRMQQALAQHSQQEQVSQQNVQEEGVEMNEGGLIDIIEQFRTGGSYKTSGIPTNGSIKITGNHNISPSSYNPHLFDSSSDNEKLNPVTDKINSTVSEVPEEIASIEAEKGELIVKPNLGGIYKILGKTHAAGGVKLNPEPGSFIFSNDPNLAITKSEKKLFQFKEGGSIAKSKNTPSKLLGREIDLKEYNRYMSILQNPKAELIEKATAQLMVEKYQKTMGQVAYLQEAKKNEQPPNFSMGTAPMKNQHIQADEDEQEMYKMGGLTTYPWGGGIPCPCGRNPDGSCKPCTEAQLEALSQGAPRTTADKVPKDYKSIYKKPTGELFNKEGIYMKGNRPNAIPGGKPNSQWEDSIINRVYEGWTPEQLIKAKHITPGGWEKVFKPYFDSVGKTTFGMETPDKQLFVPNEPTPGYNPTPDKPLPPQPPVAAPPAGDTSGTSPLNFNPSLSYDIKGYLTPAQKANLSYLGLQAMNIKKYMPMREQIHLNDVSLDKVNLQPFLNNINNQQFQAYNSLNASDPRNAKLMASNIAGKGMDSVQQAIGQVENSNVQIGNQENLTNLQQHNQEEMFNVENTGKYYDQTVAANQAFDDESRFAKGQVMSTLNKYQGDQDALAWGLASQAKFGNRPVYDKNGKLIAYQPTPLYGMNRKGQPVYNADVASLNMASGADRTNSFEEHANNIKALMAMGMDYKSAAYVVVNMMKSKNPQYQSNPYFGQ